MSAGNGVKAVTDVTGVTVGATDTVGVIGVKVVSVTGTSVCVVAGVSLTGVKVVTGTAVCVTTGVILTGVKGASCEVTGVTSTLAAVSVVARVLAGLDLCSALGVGVTGTAVVMVKGACGSTLLRSPLELERTRFFAAALLGTLLALRLVADFLGLALVVVRGVLACVT